MQHKLPKYISLIIPIHSKGFGRMYWIYWFILKLLPGLFLDLGDGAALF